MADSLFNARELEMLRDIVEALQHGRTVHLLPHHKEVFGRLVDVAATATAERERRGLPPWEGT